MAIETTSLQRSGHGFATNATSADASACEVVIAAPGAGYALALTSVVISSAAAINVTVGAGKSDTAVTSPIIGPVYCAANTTVSHVFAEPIRLAENTALTCDASGAGALCIVVEGVVLSV
ncbi:MAG: hypothetical protein JXA69_14940 [Phycisphaerae bacterium]|nr:hypothetical protein [Phycisphaerae bacterium]